MIPVLSQALVVAFSIWMALPMTSAISLGQVLRRHDSLSLLHDILLELRLLPTYEEATNVTFLAMDNEAIVYLADWGLNLTQVNPTIARAILNYHVLEGVQLSEDLFRESQEQVAHSILRPPTFTNVSDGPVVKLKSCSLPTAGGPATLAAQSGLQSISKIVDVDLRYDSGVVHVIDRNLVLPHNISETTNLVNKLHLFWRLISKACLGQLLEELRDTTIFIPDNTAVQEALPKLESLTHEQLAAIVANHVVPDAVLYGTDFSSRNKMYSTLAKETINVTRVSAGNVLVNNAKIVEEDILIYGGVAHVIDKVLFPEHEIWKYPQLLWKVSFHTDAKTVVHFSLAAAACGVVVALLKFRQRSLLRAGGSSTQGYAKSDLVA